jgi:hypothetical protein
MGWSLLKWRLWFAWQVRGPADWLRASLVGTVLLNLLLPLEVEAALALVGIDAELGPAAIWLEALALSAIALGLTLGLRRLLVARPAARTEPGPLVRAGARTGPGALPLPPCSRPGNRGMMRHQREQRFPGRPRR